MSISTSSVQEAQMATANLERLLKSTAPPEERDEILELAVQICAEGDRLLFGYGTRSSPEMAFKKFLEAANPPFDFAPAQNSLGFMYERGIGCEMNISHAIHWYQLAAAQKYADAINNLGMLYESGTGPVKDYEIAAQFYLEAAEMNHLDAMNNLGYCYQHGKGTKQDYAEAARW